MSSFVEHLEHRLGEWQFAILNKTCTLLALIIIVLLLTARVLVAVLSDKGYSDVTMVVASVCALGFIAVHFYMLVEGSREVEMLRLRMQTQTSAV